MSARGDRPVGLECLENFKSKISKEWKPLGRRLGLSEEDLDNVGKDRNSGGHRDVCYGMLCLWKTRKGKEATYNVLAEALRKEGRVDLADDLLDGEFDGGTAADNIPSASNTVSEVSQSTSTRADNERVTADRPKKRPAASAIARLPRYIMDNKIRGKCLILTYDKFWDDDTLDEEWSRPGNEVDSENLEHVFNTLGFDVDNELNLNKEDTMKTIKKMAKKSSFDSFVLFVCSHGNEESFYTSDKQEVALQDVITPFNADKCPGFGGKPKIFFFNSCRGEKEDQLAKVRDTRPSSVKRGIGSNLSYYRPTQADFCVVLSTVSGYFSFRYMDCTKGSYFVRNFTTTLTENYTEHHLVDILTMSNDTLLQEFEEERKSSLHPDLVCQVPTIISTLSKAIYFVH